MDQSLVFEMILFQAGKKLIFLIYSNENNEIDSKDVLLIFSKGDLDRRLSTLSVDYR